jgi:hydrogenase/urease accessory protein HupE
MAETVYLLCALTSVMCAALLTRSWLRSRVRLLLWSSLCFVGLAVNNVLLFIDLVVVPEVNLATVRSTTALLSIGILVIALVWERR